MSAWDMCACMRCSGSSEVLRRPNRTHRLGRLLDFLPESYIFILLYVRIIYLYVGMRKCPRRSHAAVRVSLRDMVHIWYTMVATVNSLNQIVLYESFNHE